MTSQPDKQTVTIYTLPNISRSKGNQTIKFDKLIKYNNSKNFLEQSYKNRSGETIPRFFFK